MYARIENGAVARYPYSLTDLRRDNPNTTFPNSPSESDLLSFGVALVYNSTPPQYDVMTQNLAEGIPVFNAQNRRWEQSWQIAAKSPEEIAAAVQALQNDIVHQTQERLDAFARTRNYDGILSACTYAASTVPKFRDEGQYCVNARDATWASLYQFMAEVEAGQRPVPTGYADVEPSLPALEWPA